MSRAHSAAKTRKVEVSHKPTLTLVPKLAPAPRRLMLEGNGHPDCTEFETAFEAIEGVVTTLRSAMERLGRKVDIGLIEKSCDLSLEDDAWHWRVQVMVPSTLTHSALELAKHMSPKRNAFTAPIGLLPLY